MEITKSGPVNFKRLLEAVTNKYKKLQAENASATHLPLFFNSLIKHANNADKNVLLYAGQWRNFNPVSLAQGIIATSKLGA